MGRCRKTDLVSRNNMLMRPIENPDDITIGVYRAYVSARNQQSTLYNNEEKYSTVTQDPSILCERYLPSVVEFITCFAKKLVWFNRLSTRNQKTLIKSSLIEVLVIQDAGCIDIEYNRCVNHRLKCVMDIQLLSQYGCFGQVLKSSLEVTSKLSQLSLTSVELSLLIALCLFASDREDVDQDLTGLAEIEEKLLLTIKCQLFMNHSQPRKMLPKVIEILCSLRGLTAIFLDDLLELTMEDTLNNR